MVWGAGVYGAELPLASRGERHWSGGQRDDIFSFLRLTIISEQNHHRNLVKCTLTGERESTSALGYNAGRDVFPLYSKLVRTFFVPKVTVNSPVYHPCKMVSFVTINS